jgi:peptidyl-Lys metalloendopeptidase
MLRLFGTVLVVIVSWALPAQATVYERCEKTQIAAVAEAMKAAHKIVIQAAGAVSDSAEFNRWFGPYVDKNAALVRTNLKAIHAVIASGGIGIVCPNTLEDECDADTYANVDPDAPFTIYLCPSFFRMPTLSTLREGTNAFDNGTREGTIIHELSHFNIVAGTDDNCYSRTLCADMTISNLVGALHNADSYQYFAEDVTRAKAAMAGRN